MVLGTQLIRLHASYGCDTHKAKIKKKQLNILKRRLVEFDVDSEIMHVEETTTVYQVNGLKMEKVSIQKHDEEITALLHLQIQMLRI